VEVEVDGCDVCVTARHSADPQVINSTSHTPKQCPVPAKETCGLKGMAVSRGKPKHRYMSCIVLNTLLLGHLQKSCG
jgi:hypothetical protein